MDLTTLPLILTLALTPPPPVTHVCAEGYVMTREAGGGIAYTCQSPMSDKKSAWLAATYFGLVGADVHLTATLLDRGAVEKNPLVRPLTVVPGSLGLKVAMNSGLAYIIYRYVPRPHRWKSFAALCAVNGAVVAWNYRQYRQHYAGVR